MLKEDIPDQSAKVADPSPMQILAVLADAFRDQAAMMKSIESKMAREETQARIKSSLTEVLAGVETIALRQQESFQAILAKIDRNPPSKDGGKK